MVKAPSRSRNDTLCSTERNSEIGNAILEPPHTKPFISWPIPTFRLDFELILFFLGEMSACPSDCLYEHVNTLTSLVWAREYPYILGMSTSIPLHPLYDCIPWPSSMSEGRAILACFLHAHLHTHIRIEHTIRTLLIYMDTCVHACIHTHLHKRKYTQICGHEMHTYTYIHTQTHTYTHTYTHT